MDFLSASSVSSFSDPSSNLALNPTLKLADVPPDKIVAYIFWPTHRAFLLYAARLKHVFSRLLDQTHQTQLLSPRTLEYINTLHHIGILVNKSTVQEIVSITQKQKANFERCAPRFIALEIASACNFRCKHCFGSFGERNTPAKFMDYGSAAKFLSSLQTLEHITITGGEPLLHPSVDDFLTLALKVARSVRVNSNGSKFHERVIPLLERCEHLQVSIYGFDNREYIDFTRQSGISFEEVCCNVKKYVKAGIKVILSYSKGELSGPDTDRFYSLASNLGVPAKRGMCMPFGRAAGLPGTKQYGAEALELPTVGLGRSNSYCSCGFTHVSCSDEQLVIGTDGSLLPCTVLRQPVLGNVFERSLSLIQQSDTYEAYRNRLIVDDIPVCKECPFRYLCGGLCPPLQQSIRLSDYSACPIAKVIVSDGREVYA